MGLKGFEPLTTASLKEAVCAKRTHIRAALQPD